MVPWERSQTTPSQGIKVVNRGKGRLQTAKEGHSCLGEHL